MHKKQLLEKVAALALPICEQYGVLLWDVSFEKEGKNHVLTIFIDRAEGGVFIEDCERVSRAIDPRLDEPEFDSMPPYTLSVSSAGVERRISRPEHFGWAAGKAVEVSFYKAEPGMGASVVGVLEARGGETLTLSVNGEKIELPLDKVSNVRAHFSL